MTFGPVLSDAVSGAPSFAAGQWRLLYSGLYVPNGTLTTRSGALSVDSFAATIAGTTVSIGSGRGVVQGATSGTQGAYPVYSTTTVTQALNAASSQDRIDLIYLWLQDNEVDASGAVQATFVYLAGTPSGSPVAPTIPAGRSGFPICTVSVPHTGSPTVTQAGIMPYTAAAGGIVPAFSSSQPGSAENGQVRWRADRLPTVQPGPLEIWDSTNSLWDPIVPDAYPRGRVASTKLSTAGANSSNTTPIVYLATTVTLTSGRRYRMWAAGNLNGSGGLRGAIGLYYISGLSMPANAVGATNIFTNSNLPTDGAPDYTVSEYFVAPSSGSFTIAMTYNLVSGTGNVTVSGTQQIWLEDSGI